MKEETIWIPDCSKATQIADGSASRRLQDSIGKERNGRHIQKARDHCI
jgi:hypothetical protein